MNACTPLPLLNIAASNAASTRTIIIVGGGFCGTILAIRLLQHVPSSPTRIVMIERSPEIGRGAAYAAAGYPYLLNVPAKRMSIDDGDPLDFLQFARRVLPLARGEDFLPRELYGDYLQASLAAAVEAAPDHVTFQQIHGVATQLQPQGDRHIVHLQNGQKWLADEVVLASGNPPPAALESAEHLQGHPAYVDNAWSLRALPPQTRSVLIVGTGLTMADLVLRLSDDEDQGPKLHAISRRGLTPLQQELPHVDLQDDFFSPLSATQSLRQMLSLTRQLAIKVRQQGGHWHDIVQGIRERAPQLWQHLSLQDRKRFTRHLQCYWDICRHRLPARVFEHIQGLRQSGKLQLHAGRIQTMTPQGKQIRVIWKPRGDLNSATLMVDAVVNATGPDYNLQRTQDPLLRSLHQSGLIMPDPVGIGLATAPHGAVIDAAGEVRKRFFYLGPMLRAAHWETTAASELQRHATRLAAHLCHEGRL
jgi:uncharacterized NAD(P)/FAD-binding protein YdhS